jgi:hypothetical protein
MTGSLSGSGKWPCKVPRGNHAEGEVGGAGGGGGGCLVVCAPAPSIEICARHICMLREITVHQWCH